MAKITLFKELIKQVSCDAISAPGFTQQDLDNVKACIKNTPVVTPPAPSIPTVPTVDNCVPAATEEVRKIIAREQRKTPISIRKAIVKAKVQELKDNLIIAKTYFDERYKFYTETAETVEPFTSQYLYWSDEYTRLIAKATESYQNSINTVSYYDYTLTNEERDIVYYINFAFDRINIDPLKRDLLNRLNQNLSNIDSFYLAVSSEEPSYTPAQHISRLLTDPIFKNWFGLVKGAVTAYYKREISISQATAAQNTKIQNLEPLNQNDSAVKETLQTAFSKISNQLIVNFSNESFAANGLTIPARTVAISFRLINKNGVITQLPTIKEDGTSEIVDTVVPINNSPDLTQNIFESGLSAFSVINVEAYNRENPNPTGPAQMISDYDELPGLLYNGTFGSDYAGLYAKLAKPITKLFTPQERGLTVDPNQIDPEIKKTKDAPAFVKQDEIQFFIASQKTYEAFYDGLQKEYPKRVEKERTKVFPAQIEESLSDLKLLAQREAASVFKSVPLSFLKLARPTNYKTTAGSPVNSSGTFVYTQVNSILSNTLAYYKNAKEELDELLTQCDIELAHLEKGIIENSMDADRISKLINAIPCFAAKKPKTEPNCEAETFKKLGKDPLAIRTLGGADASLPDYTNQCYWREFTNALNKVAVLPFPDLSGPPPANTVFRYYPISCMLPIGPGLALLPIPQKFSPLFVLPTPLGTLVCLLSLPRAIIGIPLPSVFLFYIAPDTNKYLVAAPNIPLLFSDPSFNTMKFGFELDDTPASINPLGLVPTNPYKGQFVKGAFKVPLAVEAGLQQAERLAKIASLVAQGQIPDIPEGIYEQILKDLLVADTKEFSNLVKQFKKDVDRQIDRLGQMQTTAIENFKKKIQDVKKQALNETNDEKDPAKREKTRKEARDQKFPSILTVDDAVNAAVGAFDAWFDNIKFGTLTYPKDATKHNPELPKWLTLSIELIEAYARGDIQVENINLNKKLRKIIKRLNLKKLVKKTEFDLNVESDLIAFKDSLKELAKKGINYLKGEPDDIDTEGLTEEQKKQKIESEKALQETITKALKLTAFAVSVPVTPVTFDLTKKCCPTEPPPPLLIDPALAAAFSLILSLINAAINGLSADDIIKSLGLPNGKVSAQIVLDFLDSMIEAIPPVPLPSPANLLEIYQTQILPILVATSLPKAPNPLHPPLFPIIIPLDPILKPLIKIAIALLIEAILKLLFRAEEALKAAAADQTSTSSTQDKKLLKQIFTEACGDSGMTATLTMTTSSTTTGKKKTDIKVSVTTPSGFRFSLPEIPFFSIDVVNYFELLTSEDLILFIATLIDKLFDEFLTPIAKIADVVSQIAKSLDASSYESTEAGIPQVSLIKLIKMKIESEIPKGLKTKVTSPTISALIQLSIIPALKFAEPVLAPTAWIGVLALCSVAPPPTYSTVLAARAVHPILNQDDLPPWERLTHKNPLFAIFLDEIAWRTSIYSTGSLIWQTKTPAVLPYTPVFPVIHISPHLAG